MDFSQKVLHFKESTQNIFLHNFFLPTLPVFTAFTLNEIVAHLKTCSPAPPVANAFACYTQFISITEGELNVKIETSKNQISFFKYMCDCTLRKCSMML